MHLLQPRGVVANRLHIFCMDTCQQYGSLSATGHSHMSVTRQDHINITVQVCMTSALICPETVKQRPCPCLTSAIETRLPDSSVRNNSEVDHRSRRRVRSQQRRQVTCLTILENEQGRGWSKTSAYTAYKYKVPQILKYDKKSTGFYMWVSFHFECCSRSLKIHACGPSNHS